MPYCLQQAIQGTFKLHFLTGLKPDFDGIEADVHKPLFATSFVELYIKRTDAQLTDSISKVSSAQHLRLYLTAQLCNAGKDSSHKSFVILVLSTPSRLIGCIIAVCVHKGRLYGGHETEQVNRSTGLDRDFARRGV